MRATKNNPDFFNQVYQVVRLIPFGRVTSYGAIAKYLEKRGEGIHHLAFAVENIEVEVERLKAEGFQPVSEKPKLGADNKLVFFFHPKTTNGVLIELCQEIK